MSDMIERVAQAIRAAAEKPEQAVLDADAEEEFWTGPNTEAEHYRRLARAAIAAMREPTSTMETAAEDVETTGDDGACEHAPFVMQWQAAIDTALMTPRKLS